MQASQEPMEKLETRISRVLNKLSDYRARYPKLCKQERHGFRLGPPLREDDLNGFEKKFEVKLPEAYRQFLLIGGDGGAGPIYGLLSFKEWSEQALGGEKYFGKGYLSRPCPIWPYMPECVGEDVRPITIWKHLGEGTITIAEAGCCKSLLLIVTGKYQGRVVYIDEEENGAPYMTTDHDFIAWYERWVDALLQGWDVRCFGPGIQGDASAILQILSNEATNPLDKEEALNTIRTMPNLIEGMEHHVNLALASPFCFVRLAALQVVEKHHLVSAASQLFALTGDTSTQIRRMAAFAIRSAKPAGWQEVLLRLLDDPEHEVMFPALCGLFREKALTPTDLRPLVTASDSDRRASGIYAWGEMGFSPEGETWIEAMITDPDERVRRELVMSAHKAGWKNLQPMLRQMLDYNPADEPFIKRRLRMSMRSVWQAIKSVFQNSRS